MTGSNWPQDGWSALARMPLARGLAAALFGCLGALLVAVVVAGWATGDGLAAAQAPAFAGPMAVAGWQLATGRYRPVLLIGVAEASLIVQVGISPPLWDSTADAGLVALATAGLLFVSRRPIRYVGVNAVAIGVAQWWWHAGEGWAAQLVEAVALAVAFSFAAMLIAFMRGRAHHEESRYRNLFEFAPMPLWEFDMTAAAAALDELPIENGDDLRRRLAEPGTRRALGRRVVVTNVNRAAIEWLGLPRSAILGRVNAGRLPPGGEQVLVEHLVAVWEGRRDCRVDVTGAYRDGSEYRVVFTTTIPQQAGRPDLSRAVSALSDVTEQHLASQRLHDLVRSKDEFIAAVSHELRTPLSVVVGLSAELQERFDAFDEAEARELIGLVVSESTEVAAIVEDLLVAAREMVGAVPISLGDVDLTAEAHRVADRLGPLAVDLAGPGVACWGDPVRVRQILRNLVVNARRYGGSAVRMVVDVRDEGAVVEVRDDGAPLPPDTQSAIFDAYHRAHQDGAPQASVGLGLTVSRQLARRMGGDVTYRHDGEESVFTLRLATPGSTPASDPPAPALVPNGARPDQGWERDAPKVSTQLASAS